jgi:hypothetical protein
MVNFLQLRISEPTPAHPDRRVEVRDGVRVAEPRRNL